MAIVHSPSPPTTLLRATKMPTHALSSSSSQASRPFGFWKVVSSQPRIAPVRRRAFRTAPRRQPNLKRLTSRVVELTRRKQLSQVFDEIEAAKKRFGKLNTIVMNAVIEACVQCGDIDSALRIFNEMSEPDGCGVDSITYGTLLKGFGEARRIDQAFDLLESIEEGTALGSPKLSAALLYGLLNALVESGDLRRANGLLARYGFLLREGGSLSVSVYNLLMKGYIATGFPLSAISLHGEMLDLGLKPDRLTYNTLISACVKSRDLDAAKKLFKEMKGQTEKLDREDTLPDIVTYTTLLKGLGDSKDLLSVLEIVLEIKLCQELAIDRTAYTAMIDALLSCGSIKGALAIFGELLKRSSWNSNLQPKPHLYLSLMRTFARMGDYNMVKRLHYRMWPDCAGTVTPTIQEEADHLLMEAALNDGQIDVAVDELASIVNRWKRISWASRGGSVVLQIEALLGFNKSMCSPHLLPQVMPSAPIESIMMPFEQAQPLHGSLPLKKVAMLFFNERVVPIIDDWGSCIGVLHREDCNELNSPLSAMMRTDPPCVTITTSISHVVDLMLEKRHEMVIIVKHADYSSYYNPSLRAVGVFTADQLQTLISSTPGGRII